MNLVYLLNLPLQSVMTSTRVAADTFDALIGAGAAGVISALVMFSSFGALNGIVLVGPRVYYQMSKDGLWFKFAGHYARGGGGERKQARAVATVRTDWDPGAYNDAKAVAERM